ncbi:probable L-type lectin-domain containing receptor kinase S.5 [Andrographis paniculata]|uniref:probable L-type lectin-domain containing receptor kinase S.5 n=1 Tax=Andrographis paniculata TaxID=175694 RepID=UPI0021E83C54|nr:probable L-type lectin-domain containing receptor kinase S.5 [Andrographis paniculata]
MRKLTAANLMMDIAMAAFLLLQSFAVIAEDPKLQTFTGEYGSFNETNSNMFSVTSTAAISNGGLQLTPDSFTSRALTGYYSGRILLKRPFRLWEEENSVRNVASFNTSFLINVYKFHLNTTAEGLAFVIAPDLDVPTNSNGQFLGLTNSHSDGMEDNKLVAVELDASKQYFDPDDNHVGIDVHSIISVKTASLTPHNISVAPAEGARFYNVWIDYSGFTKVMDVYIAEQSGYWDPTPKKPGSPILSADLNLRDHVSQYSYFGFSASTGNDMQLNSVVRWNLTIHHFPDTKTDRQSWKRRWKIALGSALGAMLLILICASMAGYCLYKKRIAYLNHRLGAVLRCLPGMPKEFRFKDLKKATNSFGNNNKLGQGGFGVVYKGVLAKEKINIAVKWFSRETTKSQHDFLAELTIINRLRHKHLIKLLGWCYKNGKLLLVYEYMPNGSLDQHLFVGGDAEPLKWNLRQQVLSGVVSALHYLHNEYDKKVVHRDLKASNIMLDSNFNARLGDFGLARALDNEKTSYAEAEGVMGTMGYIAPECFLTGKATRQSDVYAFGAVLLEVVCGQRPGTKIAGFQFLVDWVWLLHREGRLLEAVDQRLGNDYIAEEAERLLLLGLACSHPNASERPKTKDVFQIMSGTMPLPTVPPFKPAFVWPATACGAMDMESINTQSITNSFIISGR